MTWQSGLPRVETMPARPCSVTPRKRCGWAAARKASIAIWTPPSVPFLKPTGIERPEASSRWTWLSVVRAPIAPQVTRSEVNCGVIGSRNSEPEGRPSSIRSSRSRRAQRPDALDVQIAGLHRSPIVLKREAEAAVHQTRRADRDDALARAAGRVRLAEEVLDPDEGLGPFRERTRDEEVQDDVASEGQRIQVVLELAADVAGRRLDGGDRRG